MQGAKTTDSGDDRDDTDRRDGAVQTSPRACVVDVSFRRVVAKDTTLGGGAPAGEVMSKARHWGRRVSRIEGTTLGASKANATYATCRE